MRVLVTGVGGPTGHAVAILLAERGHQVFGVDMRQVEVPAIETGRVPAADDPSFLSSLYWRAREHKADMVIPTVDEELISVAAYAETGLRLLGIPVLIGPPRAVFMARDKYLTCAHLQEHGLNVPHFLLPSEVNNNAFVAGLRLGWPWLSKPRLGRGGHGIFVCRWEDRFAVHLDDSQVLQEFIPGQDYCVDLYISPRSGKTVYVALEKTDLEGGIVGNALTVRRAGDADRDVGELALRACHALGLHGPADTPLPKIKALVSSGNALTGEIDPRRWTRLYQDVQKEYGEEAAKTMMGIYQERQFRRLYREVKKALPADMQDELDAKKDKIKSIEGLGQALNTLVAEYGETLPLNFMVFTWGGKVHYMIRMNATLKGTMDAIAQSCKASERDINEVLSLAIQKGWGNRVDSG